MSIVAVVGSVNTDLVAGVPHLPAPGETVLGGDLAVGPGGKGANQAVAAARLGADTVLLAATGDDLFGAELRTALAAENLDVSRVATIAGVPTGVALIVVGPDGRNMITVTPGANRHLDASHLDGLSTLPADGTADPVVLLQLEIPRQTSLAATRQTRRAGARLVLNAAPLTDPHDPTLIEVVAGADVLVVNQIEAQQLATQPPPGDLAGWARLADGLRKLGPRAAVVTLGEKGAVAVEDGHAYVQPAFAVDVVDTTGAGDAFCGALAAGLAQGRPLAGALRRACAAGALATTKLGAQAALPTIRELERLLRTAEGS